MAEPDAEYFDRRIGEELAKAEQALSPEVRHVHTTLARLYRIRLDALVVASKAA